MSLLFSQAAEWLGRNFFSPRTEDNQVEYIQYVTHEARSVTKTAKLLIPEEPPEPSLNPVEFIYVNQ